jgi:hypothetical protein
LPDPVHYPNFIKNRLIRTEFPKIREVSAKGIKYDQVDARDIHASWHENLEDNDTKKHYNPKPKNGLALARF